MDGLKTGRIVYFVFDEQSADEVNRRRTTGGSIAERMKTQVDAMSGQPLFAWPTGAQAHIGNPVLDGDICPAMVVRVNGPENVNLKVMLDGTDVFWATSVGFSADKQPRSWHWMFEGQSTRYDATKQQ